MSARRRQWRFAARVAWRSLRGDPRATAWSLAALTACATLVVAFTTVSLEAGRQMGQTLRRLGSNAVLQGPNRAAAAPGPGAAVRWATLADTARAAGAEAAVLRVRPATVAGLPAAVVEADPAALAALTPNWRVRGRRPAGPGEGAVGQRLAVRLEVEEGDAVALRWAPGPGSDTEAQLRVTGVVEAGDEDDDRVFVAPRAVGDRAATADTAALVYALLSVPGGERGIARQDRLRRVQVGVEVRPRGRPRRARRRCCARWTCWRTRPWRRCGCSRPWA